MQQRMPMVAGNWKMNGSRASAEQLLGNLAKGLADTPHSGVNVAVFPPYPFIDQSVSQLQSVGVQVGAQCVSPYEKGAYTGSVSAQMLAEQGCKMALAGHSERRAVFGESDEEVAQQVQRILQAGLQPIICVGETREQRAAGETLDVIKRQLAAVLALDDNRDQLAKWVVAYEPVWAIGTGERATPENIVEVHQFIRQQLCAIDPSIGELICILYGGSVKAENAGDLFGLDNVDGALIGGASLDADEFLEIITLCCRYY
jgi:triosephosphate isomerase (TIM)